MVLNDPSHIIFVEFVPETVRSQNQIAVIFLQIKNLDFGLVRNVGPRKSRNGVGKALVNAVSIGIVELCIFQTKVTERARRLEHVLDIAGFRISFSANNDIFFVFELILQSGLFFFRAGVLLVIDFGARNLIIVFGANDSFAVSAVGSIELFIVDQHRKGTGPHSPRVRKAHGVGLLSHF